MRTYAYIFVLKVVIESVCFFAYVKNKKKKYQENY